jgi:hypothetical protein
MSKQEMQDVISSKPLAIENLLKKVYRNIQRYNPNVNKENNLSGDQSNLNISNNENLNINRTNHEEKQMIMNINYNNANDQQLRKIIEEKDNNIQELKYIIEVMINSLFLI